MARIELDKVSLTFQVRQHGKLTLKEFLLRRMYRASINPLIRVEALKDLSLQAQGGERIGVLGHNGAGKSTLLRVLSGIYPPTSGNRLVEGHISSLFDIALGFEMEASGWENIRLRGYLQGETPRTLAAKIQEIADFSELGSFLDMPIRYYSAGMLVRLAFSIATTIEPEVLLIDEALQAGDHTFQPKAAKRLGDMMNKAQIVIMVSHDLETLKRTCTRGLWMDHGQLRKDGPIHDVVAEYLAWANSCVNAA